MSGLLPFFRMRAQVGRLGGLTLLVLAAFGAQGATLSLGQAVPVGNVWELPVSLSLAESETVSSLQFSCEIPEMQLLLSDVTAGEAAQNSGKVPYFMLYPNQAQVLLIGTDSSGLEAGVVARLVLSAAPPKASGRLVLKDVLFSSSQGMPLLHASTETETAHEQESDKSGDDTPEEDGINNPISDTSKADSPAQQENLSGNWPVPESLPPESAAPQLAETRTSAPQPSARRMAEAIPEPPARAPQEPSPAVEESPATQAQRNIVLARTMLLEKNLESPASAIRSKAVPAQAGSDKNPKPSKKVSYPGAQTESGAETVAWGSGAARNDSTMTSSVVESTRHQAPAARPAGSGPVLPGLPAGRIASLGMRPVYAGLALLLPALLLCRGRILRGGKKQ